MCVTAARYDEPDHRIRHIPDVVDVDVDIGDDDGDDDGNG